MHNPPPPQSPLPSPPPPPMESSVSGMDDAIILHDEPSSGFPAWDWSDLLDFNLDDHFQLAPSSIEPDHSPPSALPSPSQFSPVISKSDKVRKRDPRMSCENFLAGRIPCACPEVDAILAAADEEEEESGGAGKKRARFLRTGGSGFLRCQVPGCEVDISELKGYHKRHRVCLRCATSSSVLLDGESKRYCQQCGKFHILSDFDEGKRSCRRKLERHNNRRRRKPFDSKGSDEREPQNVVSAEDRFCDDETKKDICGTSTDAVEGEKLLAGDGRSLVPPSAHTQNVQSDSLGSGETQIDDEKEKYGHSPSYCDDKSAFSSVCPTGRISFKLYDWNPAEFPRRLRHQIFRWLDSMPVELEGYIRPGCTILTLFIAMPKFMWLKLHEDPVACFSDLVTPGNMLCGRSTFHIYLNSMMCSVLKGGVSIIKVKIEEHAPKLHYVHPLCFEAGKPMEFVVCGSNLLQPNFRFLLSFAGKYLTHDVCAPALDDKAEYADTNFDHQLLRICAPCTELNIFGPGFIEVENKSGLSNFVPILIADEEICSEIKIMQKRFDFSLCIRDSQSTASFSHEVSSRHQEFSELISDVGWLLKEPQLENTECILTSSQLQRFNSVLKFLIENESTTILERVLPYMKIKVDNHVPAGNTESEMRLFQNTLIHATIVLSQKPEKKLNLEVHPRCLISKGNDQSSSDVPSPIPLSIQDMKIMGSRSDASLSTSVDSSVAIPLLTGDTIMSVSGLSKEWPGKSFSTLYTNTNRALVSRPIIFIIASAAVCFGICAVLLHPQKASKIAVTIRRCLFDRS